MLGERYTVRKGDNLWRIAAHKLGSGSQWPRIWKYNNRREVVRETGRSVPNPDLIYVGQVLILPKAPGTALAPKQSDHAPHHFSPATNAPGPKSSAQSITIVPAEKLGSTRSPLAFKYRIDAAWPEQDLGTAVVLVRMTGDVLLLTQKGYPITYVTNRGELEHQLTEQPRSASQSGRCS
jgi:LysM repeat protein